MSTVTAQGKLRQVNHKFKARVTYSLTGKAVINGDILPHRKTKQNRPKNNTKKKSPAKVST